jgi:hypothetical protein
VQQQTDITTINYQQLIADRELLPLANEPAIASLQTNIGHYTRDWYRYANDPSHFVCTNTNYAGMLSDVVARHAVRIDAPFPHYFLYKNAIDTPQGGTIPTVCRELNAPNIAPTTSHYTLTNNHNLLSINVPGLFNAQEVEARRCDNVMRVEKPARDQEIAKAISDRTVLVGDVATLITPYLTPKDSHMLSEMLSSQTRLNTIVLNEGTPHKNINSITIDPQSLASRQQAPTKPVLSSKPLQPRGLE